MANICSACGEELPATITFCRNCGERITPEEGKAGEPADANPYSSPAPVTLNLRKSRAPYRLATAGQRLGNLLVDNIVTFVFSNIAGFILGYCVALYFVSNGWEMNQSHLDLLEFCGTLLGLVVAVVYYVIAESLGYRTIGKLVTGTKVVKVNGSPPSFGQVLGRTAARFIPFEAFSFLGADAVGWHDSLSGTRVVKTR